MPSQSGYLLQTTLLGMYCFPLLSGLFGSNGTKTVDLTALGIDLKTVTKISFGGRTGTGSVDINASDVILSN